MRLKGRKSVYFFVMPAVVVVISFGIYPAIYNILLSFKDVNLISFIKGTAQFCGFANYTKICSDGTFHHALLNTLIFTFFSILFQVLFGFSLALLFNHEFPIKGLFQALIMIPWVVPIVVSGAFFKWFFSDEGLLNNLLISIGLIEKPIRWITSQSLVIFSLTFVNIWLGIPFNFLLIYTGLKKIPEELYESAEIDGASSIQKLFYITIPLLKPVLITTIALGCIFTIKVFDLVWVITKGGPGGASHLLSTFSYFLAFNRFRFGESAAVLVVMLLLVIGVVGWLSLIKRGEY